MKKIKYLIPAVALMFGLASCDNMDELYKDQKVEYSIYSSKASGIAIQPGFKRATVTWNVPTDQVATGVEHMRYCVINNGHLEVSYDGKTFVNVGALNDGGFELQPKNKPIYAIRIVSDGTNEAIGRTDIQPLIIK